MLAQQKLHIGCGDVALAGWVNIDLTPYPAVDLVHDVTKPLPFESCSFIFAEHFIEHLSLHDGLRFLRLGPPVSFQWADSRSPPASSRLCHDRAALPRDQRPP